MYGCGPQVSGSVPSFSSTYTRWHNYLQTRQLTSLLVESCVRSTCVGALLLIFLKQFLLTPAETGRQNLSSASDRTGTIARALLRYGAAPVIFTMAGEKESALAAALAACPVCNENIPLENMNSHIDICLLAGALTPHSVSRPGVASQLGYKRSSDSSSPAPGDGKQLLLSFGRRDSPGAGGHLPPAKSRKLASTPKSSRNLQSLRWAEYD